MIKSRIFSFYIVCIARSMMIRRTVPHIFTVLYIHVSFTVWLISGRNLCRTAEHCTSALTHSPYETLRTQIVIMMINITVISSIILVNMIPSRYRTHASCLMLSSLLCERLMLAGVPLVASLLSRFSLAAAPPSLKSIAIVSSGIE